jgi:hypothetical protein
VTHRLVVAPGEVYLASRDPDTGAIKNQGRFKLVENSRVGSSLQGLQPPVIAIGEQGRNTQPQVSSITFEDLSGGIGMYKHDASSANRLWWGNADVRYRRQATLLKLKTNRGAPGSIGSKVPRAGGVFNDAVWVAWDDKVHPYAEATGWGALARTLTGNAVPTSNPVAWEGGWFWPLGTSGIDVWNGSSWWNVAKACAGLLVYANVLYCVGADGQVSRVAAATATSKIAAATLAAGDLTNVVKISDTCSGMFLFSTGDANSDVVPHVLGFRQVYQLDVAGASPTDAAMPVGPGLPPHRYAIRADLLGADTNAYISQGMSVVQWTGDVATPAGLDLDDGVPSEYRGGIKQLLNGGHNLFALIDATSVAGSDTPALHGGDVGYADVLATPEGFSWLASRETRGWVVRALADSTGSAATTMFISTAEGTYRLWFAWAGAIYSIDLEQGLFNPLGDTSGRFEPSGRIDYPVVDFGYHEERKVGALIEIGTSGCSATEVVYPWVRFDDEATWYELYNADGLTHGITTNGRHRFLLHANPVPAAGVYADEPAVGHRFDRLQLRLTLARGDQAATPAVEFAVIYAKKKVSPTLGFRLTLDLRAGGARTEGRSAWARRQLLMQLIQDNKDGMLHFGYQDDPEATTPGATRVHAVDVVGESGLDWGTLAKDYDGQVHLDLAEVVTP